MEDTTNNKVDSNAIETDEVGIVDDDFISCDDSDNINEYNGENEFKGEYLDDSIFQRLKQNDPSITHLHVQLNCDGSGAHVFKCVDEDSGKCFFNIVDWKENADCFANNTHLKSMRIFYHKNSTPTYILGEEGHKLPARQQLRDFFSCIYQSSIKYIMIHGVCINDEFGGGLIEGLCGHPSIERLDIGKGKLGSKGCIAISKVLNHPKSKLKHLRLCACDVCKLDDDKIRIVCDALLDNKTIIGLSLEGKTWRTDGLQDISSDGWQSLSPIIRDKLIHLKLYDAPIDDESANVLGSALSGSKVTDLNLASNKSISSVGWQMLLNHLTQNSIKRLVLSDTTIDDAGLATLAKINTLCSIDLHCNKSVTPSGWQFFFNTLLARGNQLKELEISGNRIGDVGIQALGSLLSNMISLKILYMYNMVTESANDWHVQPSSTGIPQGITPQSWVLFLNALQDSNLNLAKLDVGSSNIDDRGLQLLIPLVSRMSSLKFLGLSNNKVTSAGWQALIGYLQSPIALEELFLHRNYLNNDVVIAFTNALTHNKTLKLFSVNDPCDPVPTRYIFPGDEDGDDEEDVDEEQYDEDGFFNITERGWDAISSLLCNKTSIMDTYNSNHILHDVCYDQETGFHRSGLPDDLESYLNLNENKDKTEVARQKILQTYFSGENTSKLEEFLGMELVLMPTVIAWIGRLTPSGWRGESVSGLSLLYNIMRKLPDLFDSNAIKKSPMGKRKREDH